MVLAVLLMLTMSDPQPLPNGYTCDDVRRVVSEIGKVRAFALAVENGLSFRQIWQIRRTCRL